MNAYGVVIYQVHKATHIYQSSLHICNMQNKLFDICVLYVPHVVFRICLYCMQHIFLFRMGLALLFTIWSLMTNEPLVYRKCQIAIKFYFVRCEVSAKYHWHKIMCR